MRRRLGGIEKAAASVAAECDRIYLSQPGANAACKKAAREVLRLVSIPRPEKSIRIPHKSIENARRVVSQLDCRRLADKAEHDACEYGAREVGVHVREFPDKYPNTLGKSGTRYRWDIRRRDRRYR